MSPQLETLPAATVGVMCHGHFMGFCSNEIEIWIFVLSFRPLWTWRFDIQWPDYMVIEPENNVGGKDCVAFLTHYPQCSPLNLKKRRITGQCSSDSSSYADKGATSPSEAPCPPHWTPGAREALVQHSFSPCHTPLLPGTFLNHLSHWT